LGKRNDTNDIIQNKLYDTEFKFGIVLDYRLVPPAAPAIFWLGRFFIFSLTDSVSSVLYISVRKIDFSLLFGELGLSFYRYCKTVGVHRMMNLEK